MNKIFNKVFWIMLIGLSSVLFYEYSFVSLEANFFYFLNIQILLFFAIKYLINTASLSARKLGDVLTITKYRKVVKKFALSNHPRITKGMNSIKITGTDFEDVLYYSDFDKKSILIFKNL
jgi:hypothetical protein